MLFDLVKVIIVENMLEKSIQIAFRAIFALF